MPQLRLTHPLVVLFLGDLLDLVEELADAQLQLRQLLVLGQVGVVDGVLPHGDVQVDPELGAGEPLGRVGVQADDVLPGGVGGEGPLALAGVHLGHDDLVLRVADLHVHPDLGARGGEPVGPGVVQLQLVVA